MNNDDNAINREDLSLVIQIGYAVYGVGETEQLALEEASQWLYDDDGIQGGLSPEEVEQRLVPMHDAAYGDLVMLPADHPHAQDYSID